MRGRLLLVLPALMALAAAPVASPAGDRRADQAWDALHRASRPALAAAVRFVVEPAESRPRAVPPAPPRVHLEELPRPSDAPRVIVVGFTGGLERHDSSVSGVVRLREALHDAEDAPEVTALTYNNFRWRRAGTDVLELTQRTGAAASADAPVEMATLADAALHHLPQPLIVIYGHSWGAGSIAKLARLLRDEGLEISLAVYIDAITLRNPRVPDNIRYAVNFYQRSGILRGLPLRGKRHLIPESPALTEILGSYRLRPDTDHFGWNWNLIQPLLYRHHHRISHDVRLQRYLVEIVGVLLETAVEPASSHVLPLAAAGT